MAFDGEVDLSKLMKAAIRSGKTLFLPVIDTGCRKEMHFRSVSPALELRRNRFGVLEPLPFRSRRIPLSDLDLILMPVVGFDVRGTRLGMGGGYFDRALAEISTRPAFAQRVIGVAFDCQRIEYLERKDWDVPVTTVVTETQTYRLPAQ